MVHQERGALFPFTLLSEIWVLSCMSVVGPYSIVETAVLCHILASIFVAADEAGVPILPLRAEPH